MPSNRTTVELLIVISLQYKQSNTLVDFYRYITYVIGHIIPERRSGHKPRARVLIPPGYLHPGKRKH